jgi:hypothetical protein
MNSSPRHLFRGHLKATPQESFVRSVPIGPQNFLYPEETIQTDLMAFATVYTCLWQVIAAEDAFRHYYVQKPDAFVELHKIVNPNPPDANGTRYAKHARFWVQDGADVAPCVPSTPDLMWSLGRTLRNGLNHFRFRYRDDSPEDYFKRLDLSLPPAMRTADRVPERAAQNYRVFIIDYERPGFMATKSNTRIAETLFPHLRYHLFCFLARFFTGGGDQPFVDILSQKPLGPPPALT